MQTAPAPVLHPPINHPPSPTSPLPTLPFLAAVVLALGAVTAAPSSAQAPAFIRGADLSSLPRLESAGAVFTESREPGDAMEILRSNGMNLVRLRLWHSPADGVNGLAETLAMAQRVRDAGLALLLDIHYSDTWADPGQQTKPAAWNGLSFEVLEDSVEAYTHDVVAALKAQGTLPEMVQLGNEITGGMLWPEGRMNSDDPTQWNRFGTLLKAARRGLDDALEPGDSVEVMIHIDRGGSHADSRWFFDHLLAEEVPFDVIGQSFYPWWHGTLQSLETNLNALARRYQKDIVLAEVAYPFTTQWDDDVTNIIGEPLSQYQFNPFAEYPASRAGQEAFLTEVRRIVESVPDGRGRGYVYWEPAWIAWPGSDGSSWENAGLFNFRGDLQPAAETFFGISGTAVDPALPLPDVHLRDVTVAPQPAESAVVVSYTLTRPATDVELRLYDVLGREVLRHSARGMHPTGVHRLELDVSALPGGVHLFRIATVQGDGASGSVVIVR